MKVIKNKILKSVRGKFGSQDADVNYSLMPPDTSNLLRSREFVKSLDLICEGPIEGVVDPEGKRVEGVNILKGIYLDDNPVMTSEGKLILITFPS